MTRRVDPADAAPVESGPVAVGASVRIHGGKAAWQVAAVVEGSELEVTRRVRADGEIVPVGPAAPDAPPAGLPGAAGGNA